jgi:diguanylate cyclase (GGDEF)-like protein
MPPIPAPTHPDENGGAPAEVKAILRRLDRKSWWQWWNPILVITLLMGMIVVLSLPRVFPQDDPNFQDQLTLEVRGLLGLVLIFNLYTLYQQYLLKRLRDHLSGQIEIATEQKVRAAALYEMAILDPLTGLFNRRHAEERLKAEIARADRQSLPLIVIAFDLDNFKQINDRFGHAAGDLALKEFARRLGRATRGSDFAVRLGGDEFLVVLPECPPEKTELVLSRLRPFEIEMSGHKIPVASSQGWTQYQTGESAEQLTARADQALYAQKAARRVGSEKGGEILLRS